MVLLRACSRVVSTEREGMGLSEGKGDCGHSEFTFFYYHYRQAGHSSCHT